MRQRRHHGRHCTGLPPGGAGPAGPRLCSVRRRKVSLPASCAAMERGTSSSKVVLHAAGWLGTACKHVACHLTRPIRRSCTTPAAHGWLRPPSTAAVAPPPPNHCCRLQSTRCMYFYEFSDGLLKGMGAGKDVVGADAAGMFRCGLGAGRAGRGFGADADQWFVGNSEYGPVDSDAQLPVAWNGWDAPPARQRMPESGTAALRSMIAGRSRPRARAMQSARRRSCA